MRVLHITSRRKCKIFYYVISFSSWINRSNYVVFEKMKAFLHYTGIQYKVSRRKRYLMGMTKR